MWWLDMLCAVAGGAIGYRIAKDRGQRQIERLQHRIWRNGHLGVPPTTRRDADWSFADGNHTGAETSKRPAGPGETP